MKQSRSSHLQTVLVLAVAVAMTPAFAQGTPEGDEDETAKGGFFIEGGTWISQPTGVELEPVTQLDPSNPFGTHPLSYRDQTKSDLYIKFGYQMSKNFGRFEVWLYESEQDDLSLAGSTPGIFQYGETLVNPLFAGVNLDGLADAFDSAASIGLNDFRFDYYRTAFENARVKGEWFVGWRRVKFDRELSANYYALIPGFPPLLPPLTEPIPSLDPRVESAGIQSRFEGRGLSAGMKFEIPLITDRLKLVTGFGYSALRGDINANSNSTTAYYVLPTSEGDALLSSPYEVFGETIVTNPMTGETAPLASFVEQRTLKTGLSVNSRSSSASIIDLNLEIRWRAWKQLEFMLGFRNTRYDNVAVDIRTKSGISPLGTSNIDVTLTSSDGNPIRISSPELVFNVQDVTETDRSVTYEGFYLGVGYTF